MRASILRPDVSPDDWGLPEVRRAADGLEVLEHRLAGPRAWYKKLAIVFVALLVFALVLGVRNHSAHGQFYVYRSPGDLVHLAILLFAPLFIIYYARPLLPTAPQSRVWFIHDNGIRLTYSGGEQGEFHPWSRHGAEIEVMQLQVQYGQSPADTHRDIQAIELRHPRHGEAIVMSDNQDPAMCVMVSMAERLVDAPGPLQVVSVGADLVAAHFFKSVVDAHEE